MEKVKEAAPAKSGWHIADWCTAAGISRTTHYQLPAEAKPHAVRIGARTIIRESPADWLARIAAQGDVPSSKRAA